MARHAGRLCQESSRISIDALGLNLPKPALVSTPLLVIGAEHDGCSSTDEIRATADAYGTEAVGVAEHIDGWLVGRGL